MMAGMRLVVVLTCAVTASATVSMSNEITTLRDYDPAKHKAFRETQGRPWPQPSVYKAVSPQFMALSPESFHISVLHDCGCDVIEKAVERYSKLIFRVPSGKESVFNFHKKDIYEGHLYGDFSGVLQSLTVDYKGDCEVHPTEDMDELYSIRVNGPDEARTARLFSSSIWGVLRGLDTFAQLVYEDPTTGIQFQINSVMILDYPRFKHRGLMLDTSRHYLSIEMIKTQLQLMEHNKLNVFHWHMVDDPSFPYKSQVFPLLSEKGSFNQRTHIYSHTDIKDVIEFARLRGIRVLAELDVPGHTESWGAGYPDILTKCFSGDKENGKVGPLDPSKNTTFEFIQKLLTEVVNLFPEALFHVGGDEVDLNCWQSNPDVKHFVEDVLNTTDYGKVVTYFMDKVITINKGLKTPKKLLMWQDVFENDPNVQKSVILHIWKSGWEDLISEITNKDYDVLFSSCWYLNYIQYGVDWQPFYKCDPTSHLNQTQKQHVLGGEVCMWGEYVDGTNLTPRLWPRASAVAERLWSALNVTDINSAASRIHEHRCRLLKWGYQAEPINGPGYCPYDS